MPPCLPFVLVLEPPGVRPGEAEAQGFPGGQADPLCHPPHFMQWRGHWVLILVVPLPTHGVSGAKRALPSGFLCAWPPNRVYPGPARVELKALQERRIQPTVTSHSLINYQRANRDQMPILLASSPACRPVGSVVPPMCPPATDEEAGSWGLRDPPSSLSFLVPQFLVRIMGPNGRGTAAGCTRGLGCALGLRMINTSLRDCRAAVPTWLCGPWNPSSEHP